MQPDREPESRFSFFQNINVRNLLAGALGGTTSTFLLHPFELLKIRFVVNKERISTLHKHRLQHAIRTIFQQEGVTGFYKGVIPNMCGSGFSWGFYFMFYQAIKRSIQGGNSKIPLGPKMHVLAAAEAGALTLSIMNPVWVVKTRLCAQNETFNNSSVSKEKYYFGMVDAFKKIYKFEGVRGFYRGFVPGLCGVSTGAMQFMTYEELKIFYNTYRQLPIDEKMSHREYLFFAAISKLVAAMTTYPYQVIRVRTQYQHGGYKGSWDCISKTWLYEGPRGFYKGFTPYLCQSVPTICFVFLTYEVFSSAN